MNIPDLKVCGSMTALEWPKEALECIPPLKKLTFITEIFDSERIIPIMAEIIVNNGGKTLDDFIPPVGCKKVQLNKVAVQGDDVKRLVQRLLGLGIEVTVDGVDSDKFLGNVLGNAEECEPP